MDHKKFKILFGKKVSDYQNEPDSIKKYYKGVWLLENLSRLSKIQIDEKDLSIEERLFADLADKYMKEKGAKLREVEEQIKLRNKIHLKQIEFDSDGSILTNEKRMGEIDKIKKENSSESEKNHNGGWIGYIFLVLILLGTLKFIEQWYLFGFKNIDRGLIVVPIIWIIFGSLAIVYNEEYLHKIGLGFLSKSIKIIFFAGVFLFLISIISQCSGFNSGYGLPDNVRM